VADLDGRDPAQIQYQVRALLEHLADFGHDDLGGNEQRLSAQLEHFDLAAEPVEQGCLVGRVVELGANLGQGVARADHTSAGHARGAQQVKSEVP